MSTQRIAEIEPAPVYEDKANSAHLEDTEDAKRDVEIVVDNDAAAYVDSSIVIDEAENKRLRRIINKRILPLLCMVYLTQGLDKGILGPMSIMTWLTDIKAQGQDYALMSTMLYIGITCGEPLAGQLIRRLPVAKVLGVSMIAWTALTWGLAFSLTVPPILGNRLMLGFFEATFGPACLTITVQWYRKSEQPFVSALWQSMSALAACISSLLAWGFFQVEYTGYNLRGWQYLLVSVSSISSVATIIAFLMIPDSPTKARWASDELKTKFVERVRSNNQGLKHKKWVSSQAWEAAKDPMTYALFALVFLQTCIIGGIGKFNSLLINKAFGFDALTAQLLKIPLSLFGCCCYYLLAFLVHRFNNTLLVMIGYTTVNIAGTIVLVTVTPSSATQVGLFVAFLFMQAFGALNVGIFLMLSRNIAGQTKKSLVYGTTYMAWGVGNAIAPQLFWDSWAPRYINSLYIHLGLYATFITLCIGMRVMLVARNKARDAAQLAVGADGVVRNAHAFEDLTDLENPDFRYSL